jgi:hypothetical protein
MNHPGIERIRELEEIEDAVLTGFSLSDAIRVGAKVTPQARKRFLGDDGDACTLSAAFLAVKALRLE